MGTDIRVALVGQPNVGKSNIFSRLTGVGVISSNYPGTTVEFEESVLRIDDVTIHVRDLPGTYALSTNSDDEMVVINSLKNDDNDIVIVVADATNLESGLVLCFEVMELGIPMVLLLNKIDIARKKFDININGLAEVLGIPVIPTSAKTGEGIDDIAEAIIRGEASVSKFRVKYDGHIQNYADELKRMSPDNEKFTWSRCIKLLEGMESFTDDIPVEVQRKIKDMNEEFMEIHNETMDVHIARDRYGEAHILVMENIKRSERKQTRSERISELTVTPLTGIPIFLFVVFMIFASIVFLGSWLAEMVELFYDTVIGTSIVDIGISLGGQLQEAIFRGIDESFRAILGLVIPYIMVFYIILGILEDTGYLPRAVVLLDRAMHRFGLHGGGFIPMMVGLGCNVPAIMATRTVKTKRERLILTTMIVMAIPCSAQMAVIIGTTGKFSGIMYSLLIFAVLFIIGVSVGMLLNKKLPYEPSNLAMELPELVVPKFRNVLYKMWSRTKDFFMIAVPLLIVGSIAIEVLLQYDALNFIVEPLSFITVGMLGLPAIVIISFIVGIIRKEMAYGMLIILAGSVPLVNFMTPIQFVVFGVVMAIYMPCAATIVAMWNEIGWKETIGVSVASITVAILVGTAFNFVLTALL